MILNDVDFNRGRGRLFVIVLTILGGGVSEVSNNVGDITAAKTIELY